MSWLLPVVFLLMAGEADLPPDAPIRLVVAPLGEGVQLRVVGESDRAVDASYALEVVSDAAAGGNRTTQRGRARLLPGAPVTLMSLTLGNVANGGWTARLRVEPAGASAYEEVRSDSAD